MEGSEARGYSGGGEGRGGGGGQVDCSTRRSWQCCNLHTQQEAPESEVCNASMNHCFSLATFAVARLPEAAFRKRAAPGMGLAPSTLSPQPSALLSQSQGAGQPHKNPWGRSSVHCLGEHNVDHLLSRSSPALAFTLPLTDFPHGLQSHVNRSPLETNEKHLLLETGPGSTTAHYSCYRLKCVPPEKTCGSPNTQHCRM